MEDEEIRVALYQCTGSEKAILRYLNPRCTASPVDIARAIQKSERETKTLLKKLVEKGLVRARDGNSIFWTMWPITQLCREVGI